MNTTRMHYHTHVRPEHRDQPCLNARTEYADGMIEHDGTVGSLLKTLDDLGAADNTIVIYTTDNGPHINSWPDSAMTPFRSEKNTNWEGAYRVPALVRWPGHIKAGSVSNEIFSGLDWFPTLVAAAGDSDIKQELLEGHKIGADTFKVHLDGFNQLPYLTGAQPKGARQSFLYFNDENDLVAARHENWKVIFEEQRAPGTAQIWSDPFERADVTSNSYWAWTLDRNFVIAVGLVDVENFLATLKEFPPSQRAASYTVDQMIEETKEAIGAD